MMNCIIFYHIAEYCDYASKMTVKQQRNVVRVEIWDCITNKTTVKDKKYFTFEMAYNAYLKKVGEAVCNGWHILNAIPQRETWETKRSK